MLRRLDKGLVRGYADPASYLTPARVEVLDQEGRLQGVPLHELKGVFFVREFQGNPQHLERKVFRSRPKLSGLWVRMTFQDTEVLEGIIPNNLLSLDPTGFVFTPLDVYSNNLKIFVPRGALTGLEVLGVISNGAQRRAMLRDTERRHPAAVDSGQINLFAAVKSEAR